MMRTMITIDVEIEGEKDIANLLHKVIRACMSIGSKLKIPTPDFARALIVVTIATIESLLSKPNKKIVMQKFCDVYDMVHKDDK